MEQPANRPPRTPNRQANEPVAIASRIAALRENARRDPGLLYLLPDSLDTPKKKRPFPFRILLAIAGGVLALAAVVVVLMNAGGSGSGTPPPANDVNAGVGLIPAGATSRPATATPTRPIPTPTPRSAEDAVHEGAVAAPIAGVSPSTEPRHFQTPLKTKGTVTDHFGTPRGEGFVHAGIDVSPGQGQFEVVASCDGQVTGSDRSATYGDFVVVDCGGTWKTVYANLSAVQAPTRMSVIAGQTVLGVAQGSVHFEIRWGDTPLDPETLVNIEAGPPPPPTPTPTSTATPKSGAGSTNNGVTPPSDTGSSTEPTATPLPPTATSTTTPTATPRPTSTPTPTATPKPAKKTPTPPPSMGG